MNENDLLYAKITNNPVKDFFQRFYCLKEKLNDLVIISPIVASLNDTEFSLKRLVGKIDNEKIRTYIITRTPEKNFHYEAIEILSKSRFVEIRYNDTLHAKLYLINCESRGFAYLGSGNLTRTAMESNVEIGILINPFGKGKIIYQELYNWGLRVLRTSPDSKIIKKIRLGA